jgi:hypothetical protein
MNRPNDKIETRFEEPGSLPKPKLLGRIVRLAFGALLLWTLYSMFTNGLSLFSLTRPPRSIGFWLFVGTALHYTPYVVNIGFRKDWRRKPQLLVVGVAAVLIAVDLVGYGTWWAPPLGTFVWLWLVYFSTRLGVSFVLSTLLGTPGCEMRSIPHLWSLITGHETKEHYCPGPLGRIDRWETGHKGA